MPVASYKDLCIEAFDSARLEEFYSAVLGLRIERDRPEHVWLAGPTPRHTVWVNEVPEPKRVKNRVHLDVHCGSIAELEALGATVLTRRERWTVMADPDGQEFCAFVREQPPDYRLYEIGFDCADPVRVAEWWASVLGTKAGHEDDFAYIEPVPDVPFSAFSFSVVPEPKTAKNRVHFDVDVDSIDDLVSVGAVVLRPRDAEIGWTIMADVEGNEFCAFVRETA